MSRAKNKDIITNISVEVALMGVAIITPQLLHS
jgi:hypothetical protein